MKEEDEGGGGFRSLNTYVILLLEKGLKCAVIEGAEVGGTCVNRGCVPSKALLAASGRVREMRNEMHLKNMGIQVGAVSFDRQGVADHANRPHPHCYSPPGQ